jgi:hypothetical protein
VLYHLSYPGVVTRGLTARPVDRKVAEGNPSGLDMAKENREWTSVLRWLLTRQRREQRFDTHHPTGRAPTYGAGASRAFFTSVGCKFSDGSDARSTHSNW